jgi:hypothetical protein
MFKSLSGLFSSAPVFPYILEEAYDSSWGNWTHYRGKIKVRFRAFSIAFPLGSRGIAGHSEHIVVA